MRFSGHESFACRYAWLPKVYRLLSEDPRGLTDEHSAMVRLGLGKNMVRSARFWVEVMDVASAEGDGAQRITPFGEAVFSEQGFDPFMEDIRTLWLLHWKIATHSDNPVFAWQFMFNNWPQSDFTKSEVVRAFGQESERLGKRHSEVTLSQHFDVFVHTYVRPRLVVEESIDGPLTELDLIQVIGDRRPTGTARREPIFSFRRETKPEISQELFECCVLDYWNQWHPEEATLTFKDIAHARCSVGQVFKLTEEDIRARLDLYTDTRNKSLLRYQSSTVQGLISRPHRSPDASALLARVFTSRPSRV